MVSREGRRFGNVEERGAAAEHTVGLAAVDDDIPWGESEEHDGRLEESCADAAEDSAADWSEQQLQGLAQAPCGRCGSCTCKDIAGSLSDMRSMDSMLATESRDVRLERDGPGVCSSPDASCSPPPPRPVNVSDSREDFGDASFVRCWLNDVCDDARPASLVAFRPESGGGMRTRPPAGDGLRACPLA